jgi:hypothetical protein
MYKNIINYLSNKIEIIDTSGTKRTMRVKTVMNERHSQKGNENNKNK